MDYLWTPWRYAYLAAAGKPGRKGVPGELSGWSGDHGCVFCNMIAAADYAKDHGMSAGEAERAAGIVWRAEATFICLNRFPYNSGHIMIVPYAHQASLADLEGTAASEMMAMARQAERVLRSVYAPDGLNMGINMGASAGAGVAGHIHMHALPRWNGDSNFMTVTAETRVLPETLAKTWERIHDAFVELDQRQSRQV